MNLAEQNFVDVSATISKLRSIKTNLNGSNNNLKHFLEEYNQFHSISVDVRKSDIEDLILKYQPIISKIDNIIEDITVEANRLNTSIKEARNIEKEANEKNKPSINNQNKPDNTYFGNRDIS